MILLIDNYDSFTFNLVDYFYQLGEKCEVVENDRIPKDIDIGTYNAVVLSPGPGRPQETSGLMKFIDQYHKAIPFLGICLGHQALATYFGATLDHAIKPMHGKISNIKNDNTGIFRTIPAQFKVVRYHSLVCSDLPEYLHVNATTNEGEIMAFYHSEYPICGIQFHPEAALTEYGLKLLNNWINGIS